MKKLFILLFAVVIVLTFIGPVLSADNPVHKSKQAPVKIDKMKPVVSQEKLQSKEVKDNTEQAVSTKSTRALGSGGGTPIPPVPGPGPIGKNPNSRK